MRRRPGGSGWRGLLGATFALTASAATDAERLERVLSMYAEYKETSFSDVRDVTAAELRALPAAERPVLVDVRTEAERDVSTLPGALSREEFERRAEELAGRPVVAYCTIGYRSGLYVRELSERGWNARNLAGSLLAWTHAGGALETDAGPTRRVHVYGRRWDLAAEGYSTTW